MKGREHCRGESVSTLSDGYAQDSARVEGSSIDDEPCARESKARAEKFLREKL